MKIGCSDLLQHVQTYMEMYFLCFVWYTILILILMFNVTTIIL